MYSPFFLEAGNLSLKDPPFDNEADGKGRCDHHKTNQRKQHVFTGKGKLERSLVGAPGQVAHHGGDDHDAVCQGKGNDLVDSNQLINFTPIQWNARRIGRETRRVRVLRGIDHGSFQWVKGRVALPRSNCTRIKVAQEAGLITGSIRWLWRRGEVIGTSG